MKELDLRIADLQKVLSEDSNFCKEQCKLCKGASYPCKERLLIALMDRDATIAGLRQSYTKVKRDFEALKKAKSVPKKEVVSISALAKISGYYKLQRYSIDQITL